MLSDSWPNREDRLEGPLEFAQPSKNLPQRHHCVSTATLVEPRTMPFASPNCTKMRLVCGRNGTWPLAVAKIAKVGVALALIVVVTVELIDEMHWPLIGLVWQRLMGTRALKMPRVTASERLAFRRVTPTDAVPR